MYKSNLGTAFRNSFAETIFKQKYQHADCMTWEELAKTLVEDVCRDKLSKGDKDQLIYYISNMKFIPGGRYLYYCLENQTPILKKDYTWSKAEDIKFGDELVGFDEELGKSKYKYTKVVNVKKINKPRYKVTTTLGEIIVSDCHQFVARKGKNNKHPNEKVRWYKTTELKEGNLIYFSKSPWEVDTSYEAGWLSGIMDGEGTVSKGSISISQKPGPVLNKIEEILTTKGILFYTMGRNTDTVKTVQIRGRWESIKALGIFRPIRLLENWYKQELGSFWSRVEKPAEVLSVEYIDEGEVIAIETDCHTLISNGFLSHNCGRSNKYFNNCFLLNAVEDSREDWADLSWAAESCLTTGGGIGATYSIYRGKGSLLHGTGGYASGPISKMKITNEIGREVMQGGSRRSAIWAGLHHWHPDVYEFMRAKDWYNMPIAGTDKSIGQLKEANFNYPAPLDMTNISVLYDTNWLMNFWNTGKTGDVFKENCAQALMTGEPGFAFNFFDKEKDTLRNACTEVTSEDPHDVCNLGSLNFSRIDSLSELKDITELATKFLLCGTLVAKLPYNKIYEIREKNRRLGLGIMGLHEFLLQRNSRYEVTDELRRWLTIYRDVSRNTANNFSTHLCVSNPVACRAVAPTGSIGILASTTTGLEPVYAVAVKRRYLKGTTWKYQYVVDGTAQIFIDRYGVDPASIESSMDLSKDFERRIKFQADVQDYVDMGISSTINLPRWGSELNNPDTVGAFISVLSKYCHRLRGFTVYPDGSRGGQPLVSVPYEEAVDKLGVELEENTSMFDICEISGKGGSCGT